MGPETDDRYRLRSMEGALAGLLRWGALVAAAWIAAGMAIGLLGGAWPGPSDGLAAIGIVLLIGLPALRVALTSVIFLLERDYLFATIAGVVLAIMAIGFLLGSALG